MGKAEYLAKYYSADIPGAQGTGKRKKKIKRRRIQSQSSQIKVVDEDVGWPSQGKSPVLPASTDKGDDNDDGPVVENAAEVHHQLQLLQGQAKFSSQWQSEESPIQPKPQQHSAIASPVRGRLRHDSDDESPPRRPSPGPDSASALAAKQQRHDSDDESPPRRAQQSQDATDRVQHQPSSRQPSWERGETQWKPKRSTGHACGQHMQGGNMHRSEDESPPRRPTSKPVRAQSTAEDESPPRRQKADNMTGNVERRSTGHRSHTDTSHERRFQKHTADESPPRRPTFKPVRAQSHADDESPPRRQNADNMTGNVERQSTGHRSHTGTTHERQFQKRTATNADDSIYGEAMTRGPVRHDSDDESLPRRGLDIGVSQHRSPNHSPIGKKIPVSGGEGQNANAHARAETHSHGSPRRSYPDGDTCNQGGAMSSSRLGQGENVAGGLVESHVMAEQVRHKRYEKQQRILEMDPSKSGRGASSTFRVNGRIVSKEDYGVAMAAKQPRRQPKFLEEDVEWKGGLAQRRATEAAQQALQREGKKKFQREFDEDADAHMQQELRMDDPMAQYFASKQRLHGMTAEHASTAHVELSTSSGFIIPQGVPDHSWMKRGVQPLPNRFNINPGRHWDGVHRGNGFEKKFVFQYQHNRAERERDRYVMAEDL